jgi:hypothetical protein
MKYMLLIYMSENAMNDSEREQCYKDSTELAHDLEAKAQYLSANPLQPVAMATSVRVREGKRLVTDGPFAETREQLGGYFLVRRQGSRRGARHRRENSRGAEGHRGNSAGDRDPGTAGIINTSSGIQ